MNEWFIWIVYAFLFGVGAVVPGFNTKASAAIIFFNVWIMAAKKRDRDIVLLSTFVLASEMLALMNIAVYATYVFGKKLRAPTLRKYQLITIGVVLLNSLLCASIYDTGWNLLLELLYLSILVMTGFLISRDRIGEIRLAYITKKFVLLEFILTLFIVCRVRSFQPGDLYYGSMGNAHYFANWLIIAILVLLCIEKRRMGHICVAFRSLFFYVLITFIMIYLADAKILVLALVCGVGFYGTLSLVVREHKRCFWALILMGTGLGAFMWIIYLPDVQKVLTRISPTLSMYLYKNGWNVKFSYFRGTLFHSLTGIRFLIGYGLGQYGSRVANAFAYEVMWRNNNFVNRFISSTFLSHYVPQFAKYMSMYTKDFVEEIRWRSGILSYPFSSFIAIVAEYGIIGFVLLARMINRLTKKSICKIVIVYFSVACIFDLYFDNFQCVGIVLFYLCNTISEREKVPEKKLIVNEGCTI